MEFPGLGKHCSENSCKQLDFLPMICDACNEVFCKDHIIYSKHSCPSSYKKDIQVPVCPLCNKPVPGKRGEAPDIAVSGHIDRDCQSDPAVKKRKVYANRCNVKGCKKKELVPVICDSCRLNYCLRHRHQTDHDCHGYQGSGRSVSNTGAAALKRAQTSGPAKTSGSRSKPQQTTLTSIGQNLDRERRERARQSHPSRTQTSSAQSLQGGISEDEAMARAIQLSMVANQGRPTSVPTKPTVPNEQAMTQEEEDLALARAIAASEEEHRRQRPNQRQQQQQNQQSESKCVTS
ncbi:AN1-type zinc finger protein 2A-like [Anneissia japonica]|uniref:AN1-type zinc finger protein 2A-like n=1 Tax=Anneissia japonica TaxID=1529436 RepID=UPI0014255979|nr:AN1-type zinc finger protein 2A-like [Anneissia japonica]